VTGRDLYSSRTLVVGAVLLVLGIVNWGVGAAESSRLQNILHKTAQTGLEESYRRFRELDHNSNQDVLRRINADRDKYNAARVKLNFYYVVASGGKLLCLAGVALTFWALVRLIRQDTEIKMKKLATAPPQT